MLVTDERGFVFFCGCVPDARSLVVAGGKQPSAVEGGYDGADPVGVPGDGFHAVACSDFPYPQSLVAGGGDEEFAGCAGYEADRRHTVVVARKSADILIFVRRVPKFYCEVARARGQQYASLGAAKVDIQYSLRVSLDCPFKVPKLPIPYLYCSIFRCGRDD